MRSRCPLECSWGRASAKVGSCPPRQRPRKSRKPVSGHPRGSRANRRREGAQSRLPRSFNPGPGLCEPRSRAGRETAAGRSGAQPKKR